MAKKKGKSAKALTKALREDYSLPHLSELAEHFVSVAGGPQAVAKLMYDEYMAAPMGGLVRTRILDLLMRVWKFGTETVGDTDNLGLLSEDDLDQMLMKVVQRAQASMGEGDGEEEANRSPDGHRESPSASPEGTGA